MSACSEELKTHLQGCVGGCVGGEIGRICTVEPTLKANSM